MLAGTYVGRIGSRQAESRQRVVDRSELGLDRRVLDRPTLCINRSLGEKMAYLALIYSGT